MAVRVRLLAIDPGSEESAYAVLVDGIMKSFAKMKNAALLDVIVSNGYEFSHCVIEKVASFGMPVGAEVFETVYWSGRFAQAFGAGRVSRITRIDIKNHLCHSSRAKDGNVRQALIDRLGPVGTKKVPGPLYGVSSDCWSALAVGITWVDKHGGGN